MGNLIRMLSHFPGLGRRSATRLALRLLTDREGSLDPLVRTLAEASESVCSCTMCGNLDVQDPCVVCRDEKRDTELLCVVEGVDDLWALERSRVFRGRYHVLGGTLSALDGRGPGSLAVDGLRHRASLGVREVILALSATVEGQTTAHYVADMLRDLCRVTVLGQGLPMGGSPNYLDDGTLFAAFRSRSLLSGDTAL
ncbi:MAG: recombination mediator RecR [Alphaproteobacteria bacterium]